MNNKRNALTIALAMMIGTVGGLTSGRFIAVTPTQAQLAEGPSPIPKWEYCALTKAAYVGSNRGGLYWISYFRDSGVQIIEVEDPALEKNGPAKAIARLGAEGWEMVGPGPLEIRQGGLNALYFKRPKP